MHQDNRIICDICEMDIFGGLGLVTFRPDGFKEKINAHSSCADIFYRCKGDFTKLPDGKLKRVLIGEIEQEGKIIKTFHDVYLTRKQVDHVIQGLKIGSKVGRSRIQSLAKDFYGLECDDEKEVFSMSIVNGEAKLVIKERVIRDIVKK